MRVKSWRNRCLLLTRAGRNHIHYGWQYYCHLIFSGHVDIHLCQTAAATAEKIGSGSRSRRDTVFNPG
jgi:hypothetical protein